MVRAAAPPWATTFDMRHASARPSFAASARTGQGDIGATSIDLPDRRARGANSSATAATISARSVSSSSSVISPDCRSENEMTFSTIWRRRSAEETIASISTA